MNSNTIVYDTGPLEILQPINTQSTYKRYPTYLAYV